MQGMSGNVEDQDRHFEDQVLQVGEGVLDELDLDHPRHADARGRVLKRRGRQPLRGHVFTMERCLFVDEGILRGLDEDFVGDAQRYSYSARKGPGHRTVPVVDGGNALRVVPQTTQAYSATKRSFHQELSRDSLRFLQAVAMLMYSASHVLGAVLPCFFDLLDSGHDRVPQEDHTSSHIPDVDFAVSMSPARSASGDMTTRASSASVVERLPVSIKSAFVVAVLHKALQGAIVAGVPARDLSRKPCDGYG